MLFLPAMLFPPRYAIPSPLCYSLPAMLFPPCYAIFFLLRYFLMLCYFLPLYPLPMLLPYYYDFPIWLLCDVLHQNLTIHTKIFYCKLTETPFEKLRSLQSALSGRNDYTDQPRTPRRRAQHDRQDRREFSGSGQFKQSLRSRSPHQPAPSRTFSKRRASPPHTTKLILRLIPCPNSTFFSQAQTPKVPQSAPCAWDEMSVNSASAIQKTFGTAPKSGV